MTTLGFLRRPLRYRYYNATIALIVANVVVFGLKYLDSRGAFMPYLYLIPSYVVQANAWWQVVTYMFVHANFWHIFFNMLTLFLFGVQLERRMGSSEFLLYYFVSGIGAGLATTLINNISGMGNVAVVGASGAIFSLLLAFATFFPDARIFIFGILPLRAPIAVLIFAGINLFSQFFSPGSGIAYLTHLSGLVFGYLYIVVRYAINPIKVFFRR